MNFSVLDADVALHDSPVIEDDRVRDHRVDRALFVRDLRLPHAVADHLAATELHLLAVCREVLLDFDDEIGVGKPHAVAGGWAEHIGVDRAFHFYRHGSPRPDSSPVLSTGPVSYAVSIARQRASAILSLRCSRSVRRMWGSPRPDWSGWWRCYRRRAK